MPKEGFLFVPYHAGQRSTADSKLTNSDARSHAAAVSRSRRDLSRLKAQTVQKPANSRLAPLGIAKTEDSSPTTDDDESPSPASSVSPTATTTKMVRGQRRQHMRAMQFSWRAGNASGELNISSLIPSSPFAFADLTRFGSSVIDYYKQVISPVNHPIYAVFDVTNVYTSFWMQLLQDENYRPAGLAMVGAVMQRVVNPGSQPSEDVRHNQMTAMSRLQKKFREAVKTGRNAADDMAIITVLALAGLTRLLGDVQGYETHRNSLKSMVSSRGGLDALGHNGLVKCALLQWDSFWVFETHGVPLFSESRPKHIPVYPAFPLSSDIRETFIKLPVGLQSLIIKGKISVELIEILGRAADASEAGVHSIAPDSMYHSTHRKYHDFVEACPFLDTSGTTKISLEKDVCLALLLYCSNRFTTARSSAALFNSARMALTSILLKNDYTSYSHPEMDCLFWVCIVCIDSWRQNGPKSPLLPQGEQLLPILKSIRGSVEDEKTLYKFFYNQELLDGCTRYLKMADAVDEPV